MGYNKEKVAYLRGVVDGMDLGNDKYGKLFKLIVDTLDEIADTVDENEEAIIDMDECIDDICDELSDIDECLDGLCECCDCSSCDDDDDCDCDCCGDECDFADDGYVEVECPHCGETIYFDEDMLESDGELICPNCNEPVIPAADKLDE
ncbi:MAG: hypothetical protein KIG48_08490 [Eubacteriales bacterium]|nr:hypothetical protein [Eubacteriales bacterium]MCI6979296.1 phage terminase large subunit family protein [Clostridiales bacterium]MDD6721860.1 hypothetical protein [Clostridiales bacterium]MDY5693164.1 hypothetical protein [Eubacteriales bacterium]HZK45760.1 hypothetical protein [Clostridia bacterium]